MKPKEILDEINNKISSRQIFKYNRELLVKCLIKAIKNMCIDAFGILDTNLADQIVHQFRAILKFIYAVDNENGPLVEEDKIISEFENMAMEFVNKYTPLRNYLDSCVLGNRTIDYDEINNKYYEKSYDNYSDYARTIDKVKEYSSTELREQQQKSIRNYLIGNKFRTDIVRDRYYKSYMNDYIEINWLDSEIKFNYDFGDFEYKDIIVFCAALKLIGDVYFLNVKNDKFSIQSDDLINLLIRLTNLSEEKIQLLLDYQTYNSDYQRDKLTLLQQFIRIGDKYYFSPEALSLGILPMKMYRVITDYNKKKYEKHISKIANLKEQQMINSIQEQLSHYDIKIESNYKLKKGDKTTAEYDLLMFDNKTKNLYICELKWYLIGDGEREHDFLDFKIDEAINRRLEKNKCLLDNLSDNCYEIFGERQVNNAYELLISQNYIGNKNHNYCVIDFETLQWSVSWHDSFKELMDYFLTEEYRESIQLTNRSVEIEIEGYKFDFYRICVKK